jgi:hypothetical protein
MPPKQSVNLHDLFERLGAEEIPGDSEHRYALRRALLNSRYFAPGQPAVFWMRVVELATPVVAGGIVVTAVVLVFQWSAFGHGSASVVATAEAPIELASETDHEELAIAEEAPEAEPSFALPPGAIPAADFFNTFPNPVPAFRH